MTLPDDAYARLLALRTGLRRFEAWSARQSRRAGLTPAQHQLLLAIRGHPDPEGPTIGEVADYLLLRHHSAVGLVDRAEAAGLVGRNRGDEDRRLVRLQLTEAGASRLEALAALHLEELDRLALDLPRAWADLGQAPPPNGSVPASGAQNHPGRARPVVRITRVYDAPDAGAHRVLVDRLWPRGLAKGSAPFDAWAKDVAPSTELRRWYAHVPERFEEFARRYAGELAERPASQALAELRSRAAERDLTLVTATRDLQHSSAAVLRDVLLGG